LSQHEQVLSQHSRLNPRFHTQAYVQRTGGWGSAAVSGWRLACAATRVHAKLRVWGRATAGDSAPGATGLQHIADMSARSTPNITLLLYTNTRKNKFKSPINLFAATSCQACQSVKWRSGGITVVQESSDWAAYTCSRAHTVVVRNLNATRRRTNATNRF
jgi:hypothetical protein